MFGNKKQDTQEKESKKSSGMSRPSALGLAVAAAIATGMGILYNSNKAKRVKEEFKEKAAEMAQNFHKKRSEIKRNVESIFGEVSDELEEIYIDLHGRLMAEVDELKDKAELTEEKYDTLVDQVVEEYSQGREWSRDMVRNLKDDLVDDWKQFKKNLKEKVTT